jgi:hypothetical protein
MPQPSTRVAPAVEWHSYTSDFLRTFDLDTLALQEDVRLGHDVLLRLSPILSALGSDHDGIGAYGALQETIALGDGFARLNTEILADTDGFGGRDATFTAAAHVASPRLGFGRLVYSVLYVDRFQDYSNIELKLGGDTRLRGYSANALSGRSELVYNLEYRSPSLDLHAIQVGGVLFYDAGDVAERPRYLKLENSVGVGLRILIPQLERLGLRFDFGFPLDCPDQARCDEKARLPWELWFTFGPAFRAPSTESISQPRVQ